MFKQLFACYFIFNLIKSNYYIFSGSVIFDWHLTLFYDFTMHLTINNVDEIFLGLISFARPIGFYFQKKNHLVIAVENILEPKIPIDSSIALNDIILWWCRICIQQTMKRIVNATREEEKKYKTKIEFEAPIAYNPLSFYPPKIQVASSSWCRFTYTSLYIMVFLCS